jgi:hypothetical protein
MDKRKEKYYNYVLNDLVSKTEIDYDNERVYTPFSSPLSHPSFFSFYLSLTSFLYLSPISHHCKVVYGLTDEEVFYVWDQFRKIIKDKINNG